MDFQVEEVWKNPGETGSTSDIGTVLVSEIPSRPLLGLVDSGCQEPLLGDDHACRALLVPPATQTSAEQILIKASASGGPSIKIVSGCHSSRTAEALRAEPGP